MGGLPRDRTSVGAALVDTASQVAGAAGVAVTGTVLAALFTGSITASPWSRPQHLQFEQAVTLAGLLLAVTSAALVAWAVARTRRGSDDQHEVPTAAPTTS